MMKLVAGALALLLGADAAFAKQKHKHKGICTEKTFEHCINKCSARGGKGRASHHKGAGECAWYCSSHQKC